MSTPTVAVVRKLEVRFPQERFERMMALVASTELPDDPPFRSAGWGNGVDLAWLKQVRERWIREFAQDSFERKLNAWPNYMAHFNTGEGIHFVHAKGRDPNAVPVLLLHGWPGTFHDYHKVVAELVNPSKPGSPSFNVVIPSIPGYGLSTCPADYPCSIVEVGKLFNTLMVDVLGYKEYMIQGGDWGSFIARSMMSNPAIGKHIRIIHFSSEHGVTSRSPPLTLTFEVYAAMPKFAQLLQVLKPFWPSTYLANVPGYVATTTFLGDLMFKAMFTAAEQHSIKVATDYSMDGAGTGYAVLQMTKPLTIGYALNDSPVGLLAWIGEKFYAWSGGGHPGVELDTMDLIETVAIYYLTRSFHTSVLLYQHSAHILMDQLYNASKYKVAAQTKLAFGNFPYEIAGAPRSAFSGIGELVMYTEHGKGGHFAGLDNPEGLVKDLQRLSLEHW